MSAPVTRKLDFSDVALYAVSPALSALEGPRILATVEALLDGGVDAVQLRCKTLADRDWLSLAREIRIKCRAHAALFFVNNRADLALAADADGVHIGHGDLPIAFVRDLVGHRKIIGVSTHSLAEALEAQKSGADYVSCGPLWETPTKPDYKPVGPGLIGLYRAALRIPFVAIGGIDETNIDRVLDAGAGRVAMVRALFNAKDPRSAARNFKEKLKTEAACQTTV